MYNNKVYAISNGDIKKLIRTDTTTGGTTVEDLGESADSGMNTKYGLLVVGDYAYTMQHETYDATTMPTVAKIYKYAIGDGIANPSAAENKSIFFGGFTDAAQGEKGYEMTVDDNENYMYAMFLTSGL